MAGWFRTLLSFPVRLSDIESDAVLYIQYILHPLCQSISDMNKMLRFISYSSAAIGCRIRNEYLTMNSMHYLPSEELGVSA